ncbi:MAG: hypothetical protein LBI87_05385 [Candidatus Accumulibacter sp.]|jgi:hypothetical protein|nr:hypothetical protein [Accumulibacter sp.]
MKNKSSDVIKSRGTTYRIVFSGHVLNGFSEHDVKTGLIEIFKHFHPTLIHVPLFNGKKHVLAKGFTQEQTEIFSYITKKIGAVVDIEMDGNTTSKTKKSTKWNATKKQEQQQLFDTVLLEEASNLRERFDGVKNHQNFARFYGVPGGVKTIHEHTHGLKPISLSCARVYAKGFQCPLSDISRRLDKQVRDFFCLN